MTKKNDIKVLCSIDYIRLNIDQHENSKKLISDFFNELKRFSTEPSQHRFTNQNGYNESKKYFIRIDEKTHEIVVSRCTQEPYMPYLLKIDAPDCNILNKITYSLGQLTYCNFTAIEFTLDFIFENQREIFQFMKEKLLISWRGKPLNLTYDSTVYLNNIRTAEGKGGKVYLKTIDDQEGHKQEVVRMEVTLKKKILERKEVHNFDDLKKLTIHDVFHYITFKEFNENLFVNKLLNIEYDKSHIKSIIEEIRNLIKEGLLYDANVKAKSYFENKSYLKPHPFNKHFITRSSGCTFLNGDVFYLDSKVMSS
jgi:hypothetical protein